MSLTYGYDLKDNNDQMIAAPVQTTELVTRLATPGALLVNHLPFCAQTWPITSILHLMKVFSAIHAFVDAMV